MSCQPNTSRAAVSVSDKSGKLLKSKSQLSSLLSCLASSVLAVLGEFISLL
jgi:hypothetical protein